MDVAVGLPNAVPGTTGGQLVEWARRAEARGFSSLGTIDRIVYANYEPLTALAAAAAVTERICLCTSVLSARRSCSGHCASTPRGSPSSHSACRPSPAVASRLALGLGGREDDYEVGRGRQVILAACA